MKNRNKKRTSKLLIVLNMLMLITLMAVPTYAFFWNDSSVDRSADVVTGTVTEGLKFVSEEPIETGKKLIPSSAGFTDSATEVKKLVYTITVGLDNVNEKLNAADLNVSVTDLGFLEHDVTKNEDGNNVKVTITFTIKLGKDDWISSVHDNVTHNIKVVLSLDPTGE